MAREFDRALRALAPIAGAGLVVSAATLAMAALIIFARSRGLSPDVLLYNPSYRFQFWTYAGLPLYLGVFAMGATGAISWFSALHVGRERGLLLAVGAFSFVLAVDNFFMLHSQFWPKRGVPSELVYGLYALCTAAGGFAYRRLLPLPGSLALWIAVALLAGSLAVDAVSSGRMLAMVIEDTLKFAGFCLWASFWTVRAHRAVASATERQAV